MASDKIQIFSDGDFKTKVSQAQTPVLVDFWAEWCMPCRRLAPAIDAIASEFDGRLVVGKINVDENPNVPTQFAVRGIPTLLLFKGGEIVESVVGVISKGELRRMVEPHLPAAV